jgi:hypothetical protein
MTPKQWEATLLRLLRSVPEDAELDPSLAYVAKSMRELWFVVTAEQLKALIESAFSCSSGKELSP